MTFADKAYQGAGGTLRTPFKRRPHRPRRSRRQKTVNRHHAKIRAVGERAVATLNGWKVLTKLRCPDAPARSSRPAETHDERAHHRYCSAGCLRVHLSSQPEGLTRLLGKSSRLLSQSLLCRQIRADAGAGLRRACGSCRLIPRLAQPTPAMINCVGVGAGHLEQSAHVP